DVFQSAKLHTQDRAEYLIHAESAAQEWFCTHFAYRATEGAAHIMVIQGAFKKLPVVGQKGSAFATGDGLELIEAECTGMADAAKCAAPEGGTNALAGILKHKELVGFRHFHD